PGLQRHAGKPLAGTAGRRSLPDGLHGRRLRHAHRGVPRCGGYWPPLLIGGEESLLALDALERGWRIVYAPAVCTRHWPSSARDATLRRRLLARNAIWTAWLRLPAAMAWRATLREFRLQPTARQR